MKKKKYFLLNKKLEIIIIGEDIVAKVCIHPARRGEINIHHVFVQSFENELLSLLRDGYFI